MWTKALEIASHLNLPVPVVAFAVVFAVFSFWLAVRSRRNKSVSGIFFVVSFVILILGLAPLVASTYLQSRGVYRVSVEVLGPDGQPESRAEIRSLPPAQIRKADGIWELDIPTQIRPADSTVVVSATIEESYLAGFTKVVLVDDYFPSATINLRPLPSVIVRGQVIDGHGRPVPDANVAIRGYTEIVKTNRMGNFEIQSHYAGGQQVSVTAEKSGVTAEKTGPAGEGFELVLRK
jgi:hypothetical protein